ILPLFNLENQTTSPCSCLVLRPINTLLITSFSSLFFIIPSDFIRFNFSSTNRCNWLFNFLKQKLFNISVLSVVNNNGTKSSSDPGIGIYRKILAFIRLGYCFQEQPCSKKPFPFIV